MAVDNKNVKRHAKADVEHRDISDVKRQMMELWKDTFHDSDEYIKLVFDAYFDIDKVEYEVRDGVIVAAMLGVPYQFVNDGAIVNGLYLSGLATKPQYQSMGLMSELIEKMCSRASDEGFDFAFLIPANEGLIKFYRDRNFVSAMYRCLERFTGVHDFKSSVIKDNIQAERWNSLSVERLNHDDVPIVLDLCKFVGSVEKHDDYFTLNHDEKDMVAIVRENALSGGIVLVAKDENHEIVGATFISNYSEREPEIPYLLYSDEVVRARMLQHVVDTLHPDGISLWSFPDNINRSVLWQPVYGADLPESPGVGAFGEALRSLNVVEMAKTYGMLRLLNPSKILYWLARRSGNSKYPILVTQSADGEPYVVKTNAGNYEICDCKRLTNESKNASKQSNGNLRITYKELSEILFRHPTAHKIIEETLGLPRLSFNMSLLLD